MSSTDVTNQPRPQESYSTPPLTIALTMACLVFLFTCLFSIYFCRCFVQNLIHSMQHRHSPAGTPVGIAADGVKGLDPLIIQSFPTFMYSSVKEYRREKYGLECAICLCEFEDDQSLRLLTSCCHVFHQECIDLWLESHKTCPVCRRSLDTPVKSPENVDEDGEIEDNTISITIRDDHGNEEGEVSGTQIVGVDKKAEKFLRSKTTGHSIVRRSDEEEKYTLRLPENVTAKLITGHNLTKSCTTFGEFQSKRTTGNGGFGEVSRDGVVDEV